MRQAAQSLHLAELYIGKFKYPTIDPRVAEFMDNLDWVNAFAERSDSDGAVRHTAE